VEDGFSLLKYMVRNAHAPNIRTINTLLEACVRNGELSRAQTLFATLKGERGEGFKQFLTPESEEGVRIAIKPTEVSFNIMVNGYARRKRPDTAFKMLMEMRKLGCRPDRITYTTLVKACVNSGQMERAENLIEDMREMEIPPDRFCYNLILGGLAKQLRWKEAFGVLELMEDKDKVQPDLFSYSHVITACVRAKKIKAAERAMARMNDAGIMPNVRVYSTMMSGYGDSGKFYEAQKLMSDMQQRRIKPNEYTFASLTEAFINAGMMEEALGVMDKMAQAGWTEDAVAKTLLLRIQVGQGKFDAAFETIEGIMALPSSATRSGKRDLAVPYNAVIVGAVQQGRREVCEKALRAMMANGVTPNRNTNLFISREWGLSGAKRVQWLLEMIRALRESGHTPMGPLYIEVIDAALRADDAETAALQVKDRAAYLFTVSRLDVEEATRLEERVINIMRLDVNGSWFDDTVRTGRIGSTASQGSIGSISEDWDPEPKDWRGSFMGAERR